MCNVNIATGELSHFEVDFYLPGLIPLYWTRTFSSIAIRSSGALGYGWRHAAGSELRLIEAGYEYFDTDSRMTAFLGHLHTGPLPSEAGGLTLDLIDAGLRIIDGDGLQLIFEAPWDSSKRWRLAVEQDVYGNSIRYFYDHIGNLTEIHDSVGRTLQVLHDSYGRLTRIRLVTGQNVSETLVACEYDGAGDLVSVVDRSGAARHYRYDQHLLVEVVDRMQSSLYCAYDKQRRCVLTWRTSGVQLRKLWFDAAHDSTMVADSRGFQTVYRNNKKGQTEQEIDPYGTARQDAYDASGNTIAMTSGSGGVEQITLVREDGSVLVTTGSGATAFTLNELSQPTEIVSPNGAVTHYEYDRGSNATVISLADGGIWRFGYDDAGRLLTIVDPNLHGMRVTRDGIRITGMTDDCGPVYTASFDWLGFPTSFEDGLGRHTRLTWDNAGQLRSVRYPDGGICSYSYDAEGNLRFTTDETGNTTNYAYDANGSLTEIRDPGGVGYRFAYDSEENLVAIHNGKGEEAAFEYDALNRPIAIHYYDGRSELFDYDSRGNVVSIHDGLNRRVADIVYDTASRPVGRVLADGSSIQIEYGAQNEILAATNRSERLQFQYDPMLRISQVQSAATTLSYTYDRAGNPVKLLSSNGRSIVYEWDGRRRLTTMIDSGRFRYDYSFTETDLVSEVLLPNRMRIHYSYDLCGRMNRSVVTSPDGAPVAERYYEYDAASRVIRMSDSTLGKTEFIYDERERLTRVLRNGSILETYTYDSDGNLTFTRDAKPVILERGDRVIRVGDTRFKYDAEGNTAFRMSLSTSTTYSYGADGQLRQASVSGGSSALYEYDALGRRIAKIIDGVSTYYVWDGPALLEERRAGTDSVRYLFMPGSFFAAGITIADCHYSYWLDQLGTPIALFNDNGELAWTADYTSFGELRSERGDITNSLRFQGQYFDPELGLHYNHHRYYDPTLGRFLTPDPIGFNGGPNLYAYAPNPLNWVDPWGLVICDIRPKCSWSKKQQEAAGNKMKAMNKKIGNGIPLPSKVPAACANRKNAKEIYEDCRKKGHPIPKLKEAKSKCSNEQADHIIEVIAGGGETDCKNLQPLIETVNKSYGSQMANCSKANMGGILTGIRLLSMKDCRPGGKKCP